MTMEAPYVLRVLPLWHICTKQWINACPTLATVPASQGSGPKTITDTVDTVHAIANEPQRLLQVLASVGRANQK